MERGKTSAHSEIVWRKTSGRDLLNKSYEAVAEMPDIQDLSERIKFAPDKGRIWLDQRRMFLLHSRAFGALRRELIDSCGVEQAKAFLMRTGYVAGSLDAELAAKVRGKEDLFDAFSVGPQMHALLGIVHSQCIRFDVDVGHGKFYGEWVWNDSVEADAHLRFFDIGPDPCCWMQIGYASGYTSAFFGRQIIFREAECACQGYSACRIVGQPYEHWHDADEDLAIIQPHLARGAANDDADFTHPREAPAPSVITPPFVDIGSNTAVAPSLEPGFVGASSGFQIAYRKLRKVAETDATVLFLGESGVGKEMFARKVHDLSKRRDQPFVAVNCAAIPENLVESELFGVEKGAYTGAVSSRQGRFERADGGTLFLDEIGTLSLSAQGKLLRALQEREIERVGDSRTRKVDTRVVAATNVNLVDEVAAGNFREDLFFRLNVFPIFIPPLRQRKADIPLLIEHFFKHFCEKYDRKPSGFSPRAVHALFTYDWPGNIREMENMIERGVILSEEDQPIDIPLLFTSGEKISASLFAVRRDGWLDVVNTDPNAEPESPAALRLEDADSISRRLGELVDANVPFEDIENGILEIAVQKAEGNLSKAARMLGITRAQLAYRLKKAEA